MKVGFTVGNKSSIVGVQELPDEDTSHFGPGTKTSEVEQPS